MKLVDVALHRFGRCRFSIFQQIAQDCPHRFGHEKVLLRLVRRNENAEVFELLGQEGWLLVVFQRVSLRDIGDFCFGEIRSIRALLKVAQKPNVLRAKLKELFWWNNH